MNNYKPKAKGENGAVKSIFQSLSKDRHGRFQDYAPEFVKENVDQGTHWARSICTKT